MQQEESGLLQILLPDVGEAGHGHAVDDTMVGGPANAHHVRLHHLVLVVEARHCLGPAHRSDGHLGSHDAGMRVGAANLKRISSIYYNLSKGK